MTTSPRPRPHFAPTGGAHSSGDFAPSPLPLRGGAKSRGDLGTPPNTHTTSPQGRSHQPDHIATCGNCHRPTRVGQPYATRIPFVGSWGGFVHQLCPPRLVVTR